MVITSVLVSTAMVDEVRKRSLTAGLWLLRKAEAARVEDPRTSSDDGAAGDTIRRKATVHSKRSNIAVGLEIVKKVSECVL